MLEYASFQVLDGAYNGRDAINKFKSFSENPDIILMDYRMPIKNGLDAAKEILEIDNKSKIIFERILSNILFAIILLACLDPLLSVI